MEVEKEIKKMTLGHEIGAGAACLKCKEKCEGFELHFWRKICRNCKCGLTDHDVQMNSDDNRKVGKLFEDTKYTGLIAKLKTDGVPTYKGNQVTFSISASPMSGTAVPYSPQSAHTVPANAGYGAGAGAGYGAGTGAGVGAVASYGAGAGAGAAAGAGPATMPKPGAIRATAVSANVLPVRKDAVPMKSVTYEWAPPGLKQYMAVRYIELLPPERRPIAGTEGAAYRRQQMAVQLPEHDQDPAKCHELTPAEVKQMQQFVRKREDQDREHQAWEDMGWEPLGFQLGLELWLGEPLGLELGLGEPLGLELGLQLGLGEPLGLELGLELGLGEPLGLELGLGEPLGLELGLGEPLGLELGLGEPLGLELGLELGLGEPLGLQVLVIRQGLCLEVYSDKRDRFSLGWGLEDTLGQEKVDQETWALLPPLGPWVLREPLEVTWLDPVDTTMRLCYRAIVLVRALLTKSCHQCQLPMRQGEPAVYAERAGYDKLWHPACFVCCTCSELLVDMIYFWKKGQLYCGRHYGDSEKPRCGGCDEVRGWEGGAGRRREVRGERRRDSCTADATTETLIFSNEYTQAEDQNWHLKHFCCFDCDCVLAGETYVMENNKPVCKPCYMKSHAAVCTACQNPVEPEAQRVSYGDFHWHAEPQCFQCSCCAKCLIGERFMAIQGMLFCSVECKKKTMT
ncbi:unnamed protein product [Coregonus sp. 'balchen']|nr:unnamed protein product [Coregonus sp. 'balchen']